MSVQPRKSMSPGALVAEVLAWCSNRTPHLRHLPAPWPSRPLTSWWSARWCQERRRGSTRPLTDVCTGCLHRMSAPDVCTGGLHARRNRRNRRPNRRASRRRDAWHVRPRRLRPAAEWAHLASSALAASTNPQAGGHAMSMISSLRHCAARSAKDCAGAAVRRPLE